MQLLTYTKIILNNRITIPKLIVEHLNLKEGDTVAFYESDEHEIVLKKANVNIIPVEQ